MYNYYDETESNNQSLNYEQIALIKAKIKQERYFRRLRLFLIFILIAASIYLFEHRPEQISIDKALIALSIIWVGFLPSIQYLSDRKRPPIPFFPLVGIFYVTSFGLPIFSKELEFAVIQRFSLANVTNEALILVFLGLVGMNISYYVFKSSFWQKTSPIQLSGVYSQNKLLTIVWQLLLLHLAGLFIPFLRTISVLNQLLEPIGYLAFGILYILWSRSRLPSVQTWAFLGVCLPIELIYRLATGALAQIMTLGLFMTIVIWYERKRFPVGLISLSILFYIIFNPVKYEFRALTWGGAYSNSNPIEKVQLFTELVIKQYSNLDAEYKKKDPQKVSATERSAHILLFSNIVDDTPTIVPYWGGTTYSNLLTTYIPRALWTDKPTEQIANEFGRRYKYLGNNDYTTAWNLPWIVEMYANFGSLGVLIGMPLVGLLLAFLDQKLNASRMNSLEVVIGATILFPLIYQESNFSLMIGAAVNISFGLYLMFRLLLGGKSKHL
ncbi:hypothetical protein H6G81_20660 [Scytonema hofmannii FACHB-248]|uniref:O-antigen polymerase n=1 Tax=Scytonema hofmannii FACHB-248 TaxID=1842502 RepID=A0ABR8GV94_9CYAN|nr:MULTISPECIES: hypothetical protein [Nostocales]MBD2606876.1 hypothetical protein [Scytonema hofmannii FACHB-248]